MVEELVLEDERQIKVFVDPLHQRMLSALVDHGALTSSGLARALGDDAARMHYHLKRMEASGLVELDHEERINGITARFLRPSARNYRIGSGSGTYSPPTRNSILGVARHHLDEAYEFIRRNVEDRQRRPEGAPPLDAAGLRVGVYRLSARQMEDFARDLQEIEKKYDDLSERNRALQAGTADTELFDWHVLGSVARKLPPA